MYYFLGIKIYKNAFIYEDLFCFSNLQPLWQNVAPVMPIIYPGKNNFFPNFSIELNRLTTSTHAKNSKK